MLVGVGDGAGDDGDGLREGPRVKLRPARRVHVLREGGERSGGERRGGDRVSKRIIDEGEG